MAAHSVSTCLCTDLLGNSMAASRILVCVMGLVYPRPMVYATGSYQLATPTTPRVRVTPKCWLVAGGSSDWNQSCSMGLVGAGVLACAGGPAMRETCTMPQWAGSCWYYLRFIDPDNSQRMVDAEAEKYWMPVDLYVGGAEHAVLHLLYARFWHKVLVGLLLYERKSQPVPMFMHGEALCMFTQASNGIIWTCVTCVALWAAANLFPTTCLPVCQPGGAAAKLYCLADLP